MSRKHKTYSSKRSEKKTSSFYREQMAFPKVVRTGSIVAIPGQALVVLLSCLVFIQAAYPIRVGDPVLIETHLGEGVSDAIALTHAVRAKGIEVVGIVTTVSEAQAEAKAITKLLDLIGRPDIPVGVCSASTSVQTCLLDWAEDGELPESGPESATEMIIAQSQKHTGNLQLLGLGTLAIVERAFESDPSLPDRLRRVVLSEGPDKHQEMLGATGAMLRSATCLFEADIPILVFGPGITHRSALTDDDLVRIGLARTPLCDELTGLIARSRRSELDSRVFFPIPHCLSITHLNGITATEVTPIFLSRTASGDLVESGTDGRKIHVAVSWKAQEVCENAIRTLTDNRIDFGLHFSHFLMNLGALGEEARSAIKEGINKPSPEISFPPDMTEEEKSQLKLIVSLEQKIATLSGIKSEEVEKPLASLKEAYLRYTGIGWWFPDDLYKTWAIEPVPGNRVDFSFGISNETKREMSDVEAVIEVGDLRETQSILSATEDVVFHFDGPVFPQDPPFPSTIDLGLRFRCSGVVFAASRTVDVCVGGDPASR